MLPSSTASYDIRTEADRTLLELATLKFEQRNVCCVRFATTIGPFCVSLWFAMWLDTNDTSSCWFSVAGFVTEPLQKRPFGWT